MNEQNKIQKEVEKLWYKNNCKGLALLATGSGKSKIFINIVSKEKKKWLLLVPTEKLKLRNWKEEFITWDKLDMFKKYVTIECYASLSKLDLSIYDGVCLDEAHNLTINNVQSFKNHHEQLKILALTATLPKDEEKLHILFNMLKCPIIYELRLKEAISLGIVAPLKIIIHELNLDKTKNLPIKYKDKFGKQKVFYQSEEESYNYINKKMSKKKPSHMDFIFRAQFIYNSKTKINYTKQLLKQLPQDKRILIFSQSIKTAESLGEYSYHSKTDDIYYNQFINEKLNRLSVVEVLNEGENIPNLDIGVIVQVNSNPINTLQRIGRLIRYRKNHIGIIHMIVLKDTVDEKWVNTILEDYEDIIERIKIN